jgi:hypothetical protein
VRERLEAEAAEVGVVRAHTGVGGIFVISGNCFHKLKRS